LSRTTAQIEELVAAGTQRLIARAREARSLGVESLVARVRAVLDKYLLAGGAEEPSAQAINDFIDGLHADDLCLVVACERGDERAWSELVERFGVTVRSAARSASSNEELAEDLAQSIWAELYGLRRAREGDERPSGKIAYYSGRGSLGGWLRAVVSQLAVDQHRKTSRLVQMEEDADFDRLAREAQNAPEGSGMPAAALDPEQALAQGRAARDVEEALARAIKGLDAEDRLLVKLYYFDGLRLREAGAVLGVHEATASRRLARVHTEIRQRVEAVLTKEHGWTREETARSLAEAASHLDTDLQLMLTMEKSEGVTLEPRRDE
jgi:RNA polymerase sigma-70 factor (ECF subfamily)